MNITDVFFNNGQLDLSAISTIINIILFVLLVGITWWNVLQVRKHTEFMIMERDAKEMDKLVKKLDSKIKDDNIFRKENPYNGISGPEEKHRYEMDKQERYRFWDEIKQNKYLGPDYLRSAIDNYLENRRYGGGHEGYKAYKAAETELFEATKKRYDVLTDKIESSQRKIESRWWGCWGLKKRGQ